MNCPACKSDAVEQGFEGSNGARVLLDVCHTCHGLWFDAKESMRLSSKGVLRLFREMHGKRDGAHRLTEPLKCPRCRATLERTHDMARNNRIQYYRCTAGHGHFITFFQFLREKGIVRSLNPRELLELKKHVQTLQCSDCGGSVSLARDTVCPSCRSPLSILDPKALGSAVEDMKQMAAAAGAAGAVVAPAVAAQLLMDKMKMDGFYRRIDSQMQATPAFANSSGGEGSEAVEFAVDVGVEVATEGGLDLLDTGISFFFELVGGILDF
ncbi:zf-TFIIB domain-containing protein [Hyalangium rubrum]|uniref:Zf-TFIIB domain-containing protein n=1 Tax=Hyalangium rubrum TaxID=3103134 RepID=A0ABU5HCF0_9BACT|nr:zf-TFIIB domain-containing protein [Hyalangium sp. s54d21]MDY7231141.1 zf-TFIIB domain-containing protein [Hyalangium sp. s54d21]